MSLSDGAKESIYWTSILKELGFNKLVNIVIYNDNMGALKLAENPVFHARSKHIDIRHHFVRENLHEGRFRIEHISSDRNVADLFTKSLPRVKIEGFIHDCGLQPT